MKWLSVDDMELYRRAKELWEVVNPFLERPRFRGDRDLRAQVSAAANSMVSNIEEGFEQSSDRGFAKYIYTTKGSAAEVAGHLRRAQRRDYITALELEACVALQTQIGKLSTGVIAYLMRSDRKNRGIALRLDDPPPRSRPKNPETDKKPGPDGSNA